jgi:hypothetical protein
MQHLTCRVLHLELLDNEYKGYVLECEDIMHEDGTREPSNRLLATLKRLSDIPEAERATLYVFWGSILPVVDGVHKWAEKKKFPKNARPSKAFSVSDEAFALVVIENNFARWVDEHRKNKSKKSPDKREQPMVKPLYTNENGTKGGKSGWSGKGMDAFNKTFENVFKDRRKSERVDLETEFTDNWLTRGCNGGDGRTACRGELSEGPKRSLETSIFASLLAVEDEQDAHEKKRSLLNVTNSIAI